MGAFRFTLSNSYKDIAIHMFGLFDGSCNISLSYPEFVVSSIFIKKLLLKMKDIILNLPQ